MKSRLVILDANVIIDAFAGGFWDALVAQYEVRITSIILHSEVFFYENYKSQRVPINLEPYLVSKKIFDDHRFCTGDTRAIKALASLSLGALGVSLEELLTQMGMRKKLPNPSYSKAAFERKKAEGIQEQEIFLRKKI